MIKRMFISLTLLGLAAFAMGGAAIAFFQTDESADVAITAGEADIDLAVAVDCQGGYQPFSPGDDLAWSGIVPGDTTEDCIEVTNSGDGELDVYLKFESPGGQLIPHVTFTTVHDNTTLGSGIVTAAAYTTANGQRGMELFSLAEGASKTFKVEAEFNESNSNQNTLQNKQLNFTAQISGYTG